MESEFFTPKALTLWTVIPSEAKKRILGNVFCTRCGVAVEIVDYMATEKKGDLFFKGYCKKCGNTVMRLVKTSDGIPFN